MSAKPHSTSEYPSLCIDVVCPPPTGRGFGHAAQDSFRAPYRGPCQQAPGPHAPSLWAPRLNPETNLAIETKQDVSGLETVVADEILLVVCDITLVPSRRAVANGQSTPAISLRWR
jgi:hypothetical protein